MKRSLCSRLALWGLAILALSGMSPRVGAHPGGPADGGMAPQPPGPRNVALGAPVFFSTNGADTPVLGGLSLGLNPPAVTDGRLEIPPPGPDKPGGVVLFFNPTVGRALAVTVTINLQGFYHLTSIRYNPGNGLAAGGLPDTLDTPLGGGRPVPSQGTSGQWTTWTGDLTADTVTVTLHQQRTWNNTGLLAIGEIEVYGFPAAPPETLRMPFSPDNIWYITQGYHGDTSHNQWERSYVCGQDYLSFDMARLDFATNTDEVRAAAAGRIWVIWPALGAVMIRHDWPSGVYFTSYLHMNPINPDLQLGAWVAQGTPLGRPGSQGLTAEAGVHVHWSFYRAPNPSLIPDPAVEGRTPNWCRDPVRWVESVPFLHVAAAGRGLLDFTDDPTFVEPCGCEGMYVGKEYLSTQPAIGTVPAVADVPGLSGTDPYTLTTGTLAFPATAHTLSGPFLAYWQAHGGEAVLGDPISEAYWDTDDHGVHQVQAFEKMIVHYYAGAAGTPGTWSLERLAAQMYGGQHRTDGWQPVAAFATTDRQRYFPETGHGVYGAFYRQWQATGGLSMWGYPISEPFYEADPWTGVTYLTQYFERARAEYHPEAQGTPAEIHTNRLGVVALIAKGWIAP